MEVKGFGLKGLNMRIEGSGLSSRDHADLL